MMIGPPAATRIVRYLFIDGAFLREVDSEFLMKIEGENSTKAPTIDISKVINGYDRAFYYDALPSKKRDESERDFEARIKDVEAEHNKLRLIQNLHVRTGVAKFRKTRGMEQKGVDILLAIEVYSNAINGNMDVAEIITSDLDFYPVFEALVQTRVKAHLIYDPMRTSEELVYSADKSIPIDLFKFLSWTKDEFQKQYKFADATFEGRNFSDVGLTLLKEGELTGAIFMLYRDDTNSEFVGFSEAMKYSVRSRSEFIVLGRFEQISKGQTVQWKEK